MKKVYEFSAPREKTIDDFIEAVASADYSHTNFHHGTALVYHRNEKSPSGVVLAVIWDGYDQAMNILKQYNKF